MKLRAKTLLIFILTLVITMTILYFVSEKAIISGYQKLEDESVNESIQQVLYVFNDQETSIGRTASDWAEWDDTYYYMIGNNSNYISSNLIYATFKDLNLNLFMLLDINGNITYQIAYDLEAETPLNINFLSIADDILSSNNSNFNGIVITDRGPMMIACHTILKSDETGPSTGLLIFGKLLNQSFTSYLMNIFHKQISINLVDDDMPANLIDAQRMLAHQKVAIIPSDNDTISGYTYIHDITGRPSIIMKVELDDRIIYKQAIWSKYYLLLTFLLAGLIFSSISIYMLDRSILSRLSLLGVSLGKIRTNGHVDGRILLFGNDELSHLSEEINHTLQSLQISQRELKLSEMRYRKIIENTNDIIFKLHRDYKIISISGKAEILLGYSADELIGRNLLDFINLNIPFITPDLDRLVADKKVDRKAIYELQFRRKDGNWVDLEVQIQTDWDSNDPAIITFFGIGRDITARKDQERRIESMNECFLSFGPYSAHNIDRLVALCGKLLCGDIALYYKYVNRDLTITNCWNLPEDMRVLEQLKKLSFNLISEPSKNIHISKDINIQINRNYDNNINYTNDVNDPTCCVNDLDFKCNNNNNNNNNNDNDSNNNNNSKRGNNNIKTYISKTIYLDTKSIGFLVTLFTNDYDPQENELNILSIIASAISIEEARRASQNKLLEKDMLLAAVASASNYLLVETDMHKAINNSLEILGSTAGVDHVNVFENRFDEGINDVKNALMRCIYNWSSNDVNNEIQNFKDIDIPYYPGNKDLYERLSSGRSYKSSSDIISYENIASTYHTCSSSPELEPIKTSGKSILAIPIIVEGIFWGFVSFEDEVEERNWSESEISILITAATGLGGSLVRRSSEKRLAKSERLMADIINFLPDATFVIDGAGRIIAWNKSIEVMSGIEANEIIGKGNFEYSVPFYGERRPMLIDLVNDPIEYICDNYLNVHKQCGILIGESYMPNMKGGQVFLSGTAAILYDSKGKAIGAIESIKDVTQAKRAKDELEWKEALLRSMAENSPQAFYVFDINMDRTLYYNKSFTTIWGLEDLQNVSGSIGLETSEVVNHISMSIKNSTKFEQYFKPTIDYDLKLPVEEELETLDGRTIRWFMTVIRNTYDHYLGCLCIFEDITDRKHFLEDLRKAKDEAIAASSAKSDFLANMSHEIRTPLNAVIGLTRLLSETSLDEEQMEYVKIIHNSGDSLLSIINDILDFSKIDGGQMTIEQVQFDLRSCIEDSLDLVAAPAAEKKLGLSYIMEENVPESIVGDVIRLRQVLVNLLMNGVKFTDKGEIEVRVSLSKTNGDRCILKFEVEDTGIGISEKTVKRLFKPFSQGDASITRKYGGTGLGLVISQQLIHLMGGNIWVNSEEGVGSTFYFTINVIKLPSQKEFTIDSLACSDVLLIENGLKSQNNLKRLIKRFGLFAYPVFHIDEAFDILNRYPSISLAILDSHLISPADLSELIATNENLHVILLLNLSNKAGEYGTLALNERVRIVPKPIRAFYLQKTILDLTSIDHDGPKRMLEEQLTQPIIKSNIRILLAEDNPVNQKVALSMLKKLGYEADVVGNGKEVLQALKKEKYDLILMDVQMPEMDGMEATKKIRERYGDTHRIIAMTAYALKGDRERCLEMGMDDYISKPIKLEELHEVLVHPFKS